MAQPQPYEPLAKAPKEIRTAATLAQVCNAAARITSIATSTIIIATLPEWFPGLLTLQPLSIALVVLTIGSFSLAKRAAHISEQVGEQKLEKARSSSLVGSILGLTIGGFLPGPFYLLLYMSIGKAMVKRTPNDGLVTTIYMPPQPSGGIFLGRYLGWVSMYLLVLYIGYTQLPTGLRGVSDWLSPVFGIHFNTLIVAAYLVFTNPLTNPAIFSLWMTAGLVGGLIAGGRTGRGFTVGLTVFLSTLGAMGLAALAIFRSFYVSINSINIPPIPTGFSITALASGPIAQDLIPVFLRPGASPFDPKVIQSALLILIRNAGLIFAIVTISGRAGALAWQGGVYLSRIVLKMLKGIPHSSKQEDGAKVAEPPLIKIGLVLLIIGLGLCIPTTTRATSPVLRAGPAGPYQQFLTVGFDRFGAPNASLRLASLDLSANGLVLDSNYDQSNFTMLVINNNYPEGFPQGASNFPLQLFSQPSLVTMYSTDGPTAIARSNTVASQFSRALGTTFTYALSLPIGNGWISLYAADQSLSNSAMLNKALSILPSGGFSGLLSADRIKDQKFSAMLGLIPGKIGNVTLPRSFGFMLNTKWSRQYFKEGPHQFSLATLLGASASITGTAAANASIIAVNFEQGTRLFSYSPVSSNTYYVPPTWTLFLNATSNFSTPDLTATFSYPFAPNIIFGKTVSPATGTVGATHTVTISIQNMDNVPVSMVNLTDPQVPSPYHSTLALAPDGTQVVRVPSLAASAASSSTYQVTTKSSGAYSLSPATGEFLWTLSNGTIIRYSASTEETTLVSQSGPMVQITRAFNDLQPYSMLLLVPFLVPPIVETINLFQKMSKKRRTKNNSVADSPAAK